ncbi:unnamed protein product [Caenorhabditis brenneri]
MSDMLQTNEVFYRSCILYEALHKKPVEEAYKNMKEVMPTLDFLDFQYWYFRFLNGNLDLNHDRSKDPEALLLDDMPVDVVEKIVEKLDYLDQMVTRNASKSLRCVVDKIKTSCDTLNLYFYRNSSEIHGFDVFDREYKTPNHSQLVLKDFATVMKSPNPKFEQLGIEFDYDSDSNKYDSDDDEEEYYDKEQDDKKRVKLMESILAGSQIHVEQLNVTSDTLAPIAAILPFFKPTILWSIEFWSRNIDKKSLEQIMKMDHWKNAKEMCFRCLPDWFPIENLFHCPNFSVGIMDITKERLVKIRDILFKSPTFESCGLSFSSDIPDPYSVLWDPFEERDFDFRQFRLTVSRVMRVHPAYNAQTRRYQIEGTNSYFQMKISRFFDSITLHIEKKTL